MTEDKKTAADRGCAHCKVYNCEYLNADFPPACPTREVQGEHLGRTLDIYQGPGLDARLARAAAEVEGRYYGRLTRVEETIAFARRLGAERIGIASCVGLMEESRLFTKALKAHGLKFRVVCCKVGAVDKLDIGLPDEIKVYPGQRESICNPILQARYLNQWPSELNVVIGLCVGHDSLFIRHAEAPSTILVAKDRVLGHNPLACLYTSNFYYRRLLQPAVGPLSDLLGDQSNPEGVKNESS